MVIAKAGPCPRGCCPACGALRHSCGLWAPALFEARRSGGFRLRRCTRSSTGNSVNSTVWDSHALKYLRVDKWRKDGASKVGPRRPEDICDLDTEVTEGRSGDYTLWSVELILGLARILVIATVSQDSFCFLLCSKMLAYPLTHYLCYQWEYSSIDRGFRLFWS